MTLAPNDSNFVTIAYPIFTLPPVTKAIRPVKSTWIERIEQLNVPHLLHKLL